MELTGKCKEEFFKWKKSRWMDSGLIQVSVVSPLMFDLTTNFYKLPLEMQYGVYVDFFDSVDIVISIYFSQMKIKAYISNQEGDFLIETGTNVNFFKDFNSARTAAIEKANEIYNLKQ